MYRRRKHIINFLHAWSAGSLLFFAGIILFSSAGRDQVFQSYWPAWTLSEFGQILNYNGEALEQSSSLLQVLLLGAMHRLAGSDLVLMGGLLAVLCGMATVMFSQLLGQELGFSQWQIRWTPWLVAGSSFMVYWSWGGLEASLAAICMVLWAVSLLRFVKENRWLGLLLVTPAFLLVRPENLFIGLVALGGLGLYSWRTRCESWPWSRLRLTLLVTAAMGGMLMVVRLWLFGEVLPHTAGVLAGDWNFGNLYRGLAYWVGEMLRHPEFLLLNLVCLVTLVALLRRAALDPILLILSLAGASFLLVVLAGGDWMENGRYFVPMIPLLVILVLESQGTEWPAKYRRWIRMLPVALLLVDGLGLAHTARWHSTGQPLGPTVGIAEGGAGFSFFETANRVHARDLRVIRRLNPLVGDLWKENRAPVTIMSQQAGMVMFHVAQRNYGHFRFIDLGGLCSRDFTDCPVTSGRGSTSGGLNMDYFYLFDAFKEISAVCGIEKPDIIFDIDNEREEKQKFLSKNGYDIVYTQSGEVRSWLPSFPGITVGAGEFIALLRPFPAP